MSQLGEPIVVQGDGSLMRVREPAARIAAVEPGSIADQLGLRPGDRLARLNGQPPRDVIDYQLWSGVEELELTIERADGEILVFDLEKDDHEDLGLSFDDLLFVPLRTCNNGCLFCFVTQAPPGLRPTVYLKDDDYRLSFLGGHFTTLTNLTEPHFKRIIEQQLSPLYVSVHASEPELRRQLLDNLKADVGWTYLVRLIEAGIACHTQIVLCPGVNDGPRLDRTLADLAALGEGVLSIGVVPVGLTKYQRHPLMRPMTGAEAAATLDQVDRWRDAVGRPDNRLVYAADELYLFADRELPEADYYDDFAQVENGVGQSRLFLDAAAEAVAGLPERTEPRRVVLVTGGYGARLLSPFVAALNTVGGLSVELAPVRNELFGGNVECAGLLCGRDIVEQLGPQPSRTLVLLPGRAVNEQGLLLDNTEPADLAAALRCPVAACLTPRDVLLACGLPTTELAEWGDGVEWVD